jgi:hypothetical protein
MRLFSLLQASHGIAISRISAEALCKPRDIEGCATYNLIAVMQIHFNEDIETALS